MSFNKNSNYGLRIKSMEKILEIKRILKVSLTIIKINILHVAYARSQITCRSIVGIMGNHNVRTARNLDMWKIFVATKVTIKPILLKSMALNNTFSMLPKILVMKQEETACSRILMTLLKSKFDWETTPWWSQKEKAPPWWRQEKDMRFTKDVLLVPNLNENLLSICQIMEKGYAFHFKGDISTIYDNYNKSFSISFKYTTNIAMKVEVDDSWLWHQRFDHFNSQALKLLYQKNMMRDVPCLKESNEASERCLLGKQHRLLFSTIKYEELKTCSRWSMLTLSRTLSLNNMYIIFYIGDFSRMTWKFKAIVEKQRGKRIKVLKRNNGKEYDSHEFDKFCEDDDIKRQLIVVYSPQQNDDFERKNHIIMEMVRSMLKEKGLPTTF
ncbi:hypothetical protein CR513_41690, partial [Mucuna pruriens]